MVKDVILWAPESYWTMSEDAIDKIAGGCGPGGTGDLLIPDKIWGLSIKEACRIHDFMYHFGISLKDRADDCNKERSDRVFLNNMVRIVKAKTKQTSWFGRWLCRRRLKIAKLYYTMVKDFGAHAFWNGKNKPEEESTIRI